MPPAPRGRVRCPTPFGPRPLVLGQEDSHGGAFSPASPGPMAFSRGCVRGAVATGPSPGASRLCVVHVTSAGSHAPSLRAPGGAGRPDPGCAAPWTARESPDAVTVRRSVALPGSRRSRAESRPARVAALPLLLTADMSLMHLRVLRRRQKESRSSSSWIAGPPSRGRHPTSQRQESSAVCIREGTSALTAQGSPGPKGHHVPPIPCLKREDPVSPSARIPRRLPRPGVGVGPPWEGLSVAATCGVHTSPFGVHDPLLPWGSASGSRVLMPPGTCLPEALQAAEGAPEPPDSRSLMAGTRGDTWRLSAAEVPECGGPGDLDVLAQRPASHFWLPTRGKKAASCIRLVCRGWVHAVPGRAAREGTFEPLRMERLSHRPGDSP